MEQCPHCKKEVSIGEICDKGHDVSEFYPDHIHEANKKVDTFAQSLEIRDKEIERLTAELAEVNLLNKGTRDREIWYEKEMNRFRAECAKLQAEKNRLENDYQSFGTYIEILKNRIGSLETQLKEMTKWKEEAWNEVDRLTDALQVLKEQ